MTSEKILQNSSVLLNDYCKGNNLDNCLITDYFELVSSKIPDSIALISQNVNLSYGELNKKADELAESLAKVGVKPGTIVGLCLRKDIDLIIAILGIMKAGGVYMPLDPRLPLERINYMLNNSGAHFLLTNSKLEDCFCDYKCNILLLENECKITRKQKQRNTIDNTDCANVLEELAYVIYTSGSTGKPKGVKLSHSSLISVLLSRKKYYPHRPRSILIGSISFDMSLMIIFHTLLCGGTLIIPNEINGELNVDELLGLIKQYSITYLLSVPSFYLFILRKKTNITSLKYVVLAGESLSESLVDLHTSINPQAYLFNEYGPSECTICSTIAPIYDPFRGERNRVSIGKSLKGVNIFILDEGLNPVETGTKGEICIGGVGLFPGYINRDELSKKAFVYISQLDSKTGKTETRKIYRTGDFGRELSTGDIEFLGRVDHQVKIRGYRIELGEIENCLLQYQKISGVAVIVRHSGDHKVLIAFFTCKSFISEKGIRSFLSKKLPHYMLPSKLIKLENFPLTSNGKIDREYLKNLSISERESLWFQPEHSNESKLLKIWKKLLDSDDIGLNDNFFDIGGDSLLVANLQLDIESTFDVNLNMNDFFQYSTISKQSNFLREIYENESFLKIASLRNHEIAKKRKISFKQLNKSALKDRLKKHG